MSAEPDWGMFTLATSCLFVLGVYILWVVWYAWNYKSKRQRKEEARIVNSSKSRWERSAYNSALMPKARWEMPPDDEVWRN